MTELTENLNRNVLEEEIISYHEKKSNKNYWKILLLIGVFYGIPSIQFICYQISERLSGREPICYYNYKCMSNIGILYAFNNIISNIFYVILGLIYILIVYFSKRNTLYRDRNINYALGICCIFEGIFSGIYHICPSAMNFQFDTTFMFVGTGLLYVSIIQKRSKEKVIGIFRLYGILAIFNVMNAVELTRDPDMKTFWGIVYIMWIIVSLYGTMNIYYGKGQWHKEFCNIMKLCGTRPRKATLFMYLFVVNMISFTILTIASSIDMHFSSFILLLLFINVTMVNIRYIFNKIRSNEKILWYGWVLLIATIVLWISAITYFGKSPTNKFLLPSESRKLNQPCLWFDYFDSHDIWHIFSAFGIFTMLLFEWIIDNDINY